MKKSILAIFICIAAFSSKAQTINFTVNTVSSSNSITCTNPSVVVTATSNFSGGTVSYYWANNSSTVTGNSATLTTPGIYTVAAVSIPNFGTQTISVGVNTVAPITVLTPTVQNITCTTTPMTVTLSTTSPTVNYSSSVLAPSGGSLTTNNQTMLYTPSAPGVYTTIVTNQVNGCMTIRNFTITSTSVFPTYTLASVTNFSLGCSTKSISIINFANAQAGTPGAPLSYTIIPPGGNTLVTGPFLGINTFTTNIPGNYLAIIYESGSNCQTKVPFSILQNTIAPNIDNLTIPTQTLDCTTPSVSLLINSNTPNVSYNWIFNGNNQTGSTLLINVNQSAATSTALGNVTCTLLDNGNLCSSNTIFPMYQNIYKPNAMISAMGNNIRACLNNSLVLFNTSSTGIPGNSAFTNTLPVVSQIWQGPNSQPSLTLTSTYTAVASGIYTLTAKDLNNGCTADATFNVEDCSGIGEISTKEKIQFYPNPCHDQLNIITETNLPTEIIISNLLGQKINEIHLQKNISIDVSQLPKGVYFIFVSQNNMVIETSRFIKD